METSSIRNETGPGFIVLHQNSEVKLYITYANTHNNVKSKVLKTKQTAIT